MNTIIEINYKKYSENVIVTEENKYDVIDLLVNDKDVVDYDVVVDGDINMDMINNENLLGLNGGKRVGIIRSLESKLSKMEDVTYFSTDREANSHFSKMEKLRKNINDRITKLTNLERLYV